MQSPFLACVVQAAPVYLDLSRSVQRAQSLIVDAAKAGAKCIAFPELWLPGYPWWVWLDEMAWADRGGWSRRYREQALDIEGTEVQAIAKTAAQHRIHVLMGCAERVGERLFISQFLLDAQGQTRLHRRKIKPGPLELQVFCEGGDADLSVVDTDLGRMGALACAEHRHPLIKHALHLQREAVHIAAWPSFALHRMPNMLSADTFQAITRTYATEGGCYVLAPCACLPDDVVNSLCDTPEKAERLKPGGGYAQIYSPQGEPLCIPLAPTQEGLIYAEIDPLQSERARRAFDLSGHSARDDILGLRGPAHLALRAPGPGGQ
jgi:aliphatic nitrilase